MGYRNMKYDFTVFVKDTEANSISILPLIERVEVKLHPSCKDYKRNEMEIIDNKYFGIKSISWFSFDVPITIYWKKTMGNIQPYSYIH